MPFDDEWVTFSNVKLLRQTAKAGNFQFEEGYKNWIPWSVIDEGSPSKNGDVGELYVRRWYAEKEGLI